MTKKNKHYPIDILFERKEYAHDKRYLKEDGNRYINKPRDTIGDWSHLRVMNFELSDIVRSSKFGRSEDKDCAGTNFEFKAKLIGANISYFGCDRIIRKIFVD